MLKKAIRHRPELKVIITSATLDIKKFADYFSAPMVKIPGKMFPVRVEYFMPNPLSAFLKYGAGQMSGKSPFLDGRQGKIAPLWARTSRAEEYLETAVRRVLDIHMEESTKKGDILLFLPGKF